MKVLVVDDSPTMRRIVVQMLKRLGYKDIIEADHGKDALARLKAEGNFELLLTDWNMPNKSGIELVREIRETGSKVPVFMITTESEKSSVVEAIQAGINDYLVKPFSADILREKLEKYCSE